MSTDVICDSHSTVSNRYYDSKSSIKRRYVEVMRPTVEVHSSVDYNCIKAEICETVVQRGYEIVKI